MDPNLRSGQSNQRSAVIEHLQERQEVMKENMRMLRGVVFAATVGLCCISAGSAHAQRSGGGVQSRAAASTGQTGSSSSSNMAGGCTKSSSTSTTGTSSTTGTTTGTTTGVTSSSTSSTPLAQSSAVLAAQRTAVNAAIVQYNGSTSGVQRVYLAVLDADGTVVSQRAVTPGRAYATLTLNSSARYYGAMVVYTNGTSKTTYAPVR
jgi:hypothetical protein